MFEEIVIVGEKEENGKKIVKTYYAKKGDDLSKYKSNLINNGFKEINIYEVL
ncbi:MAG: hypothetical protein QXF15_01685 [Candidatus Aenigmatarchaeota archaeon]|nr:hypothetical protein [Candidatus Aenigmarchaeota archaeon]